MSDLNPPVTYIRDPAVVPPLTPVFIVNGSIALNLAPGEIQIGNVGLTDNVSGLDGEIQKANAAKSTGNNVLLVQSVDLNGEVLAKDDILNLDAGVDVLIAGQAQTQATITALLNSQGTQSTAGLATSSNQTTGNSTLSAISDRTKAVNDTDVAILNNQGTLATSANQSAINSTVGAGNSILTAIHEGQGTGATSANQTVQIATAGATNAALTAILNGQGTGATSANQVTANASLAAITGLINGNGTNAGAFATLFSGKTTPGASNNVDVSAYHLHTFQHIISGSAVVQVRSSLDGTNWNIEDETNQSCVVDLYGRTRFVSTNVTFITGSVTTILMSGN